MSARFVFLVVVICAALTEARYYGQEQQKPAEIGQVSQQQSGFDFNQNQQSNADLDDTNSDALLGSVGQQFEKDAEKYEQELSQVAAKGGHKGSYSENDAQIVEIQNKDKPWYQRLRSWTGKKLTQLGNTIKGSGYKREAYY